MKNKKSWLQYVLGSCIFCVMILAVSLGGVTFMAWFQKRPLSRPATPSGIYAPLELPTKNKTQSVEYRNERIDPTTDLLQNDNDSPSFLLDSNNAQLLEAGPSSTSFEVDGQGMTSFRVSILTKFDKKRITEHKLRIEICDENTQSLASINAILRESGATESQIQSPGNCALFEYQEAVREKSEATIKQREAELESWLLRPLPEGWRSSLEGISSESESERGSAALLENDITEVNSISSGSEEGLENSNETSLLAEASSISVWTKKLHVRENELFHANIALSLTNSFIESSTKLTSELTEMFSRMAEYGIPQDEIQSHPEYATLADEENERAVHRDQVDLLQKEMRKLEKRIPQMRDKIALEKGRTCPIRKRERQLRATSSSRSQRNSSIRRRERRAHSSYDSGIRRISTVDDSSTSSD